MELKIFHIISGKKTKNYHWEVCWWSMKTNEILVWALLQQKQSSTISRTLEVNSTRRYHLRSSLEQQPSNTPSLCYLQKKSRKCYSWKCLCNIELHKTWLKCRQQTFLEKVLNVLKIKYPTFQNCVYFSDGAGSQNKNYKAFSNLCYIESDLVLIQSEIFL